MTDKQRRKENKHFSQLARSFFFIFFRKMKNLFFIFIFFPLISAISVPIEHGEFITVHVGNNGKEQIMKIDYGSNDAFVFFSSPSFYSNTFSNYGNDFVQIGTHVERYDIIVDPSKYTGGLPHHGIIGLGEGSDLWNHWSEFTSSPSTLMFGEHSETLTRNEYKPFKIIIAFDGYCEAFMEEKKYRLFFSQSSYYTKIPSDIYYSSKENKGFSLRINDHYGNRVDLLLTSDDFNVHHPDGSESMMVIPTNPFHGDDDQTIVIGKNTLRKMTIQKDFKTKLTTIHPSYMLFDDGTGSKTYFDITMTVLLSILVLMFLTTISQRENARMTMVLSRIEIYGYFICFLTVICEFFVFRVERFIEFFHCNHWVVLIGLTAMCTIGIIFSLLNYQRREGLIYRYSLITLTFFWSIWLTQVGSHTLALEIIFLNFALALACFLQTIMFISHITWSDKPKTFFLVFFTLLSHLALIYFGIDILVYRYWDGENQFITRLLFWLYFSGLPVMHYYVYQVIRISRTKSSRLMKKQKEFIENKSLLN